MVVMMGRVEVEEEATRSPDDCRKCFP